MRTSQLMLKAWKLNLTFLLSVYEDSWFPHSVLAFFALGEQNSGPHTGSAGITVARSRKKKKLKYSKQWTHLPKVGLSELPHQPHSKFCKHSRQVLKRVQSRHWGTEWTLSGKRNPFVQFCRHKLTSAFQTNISCECQLFIRTKSKSFLSSFRAFTDAPKYKKVRHSDFFFPQSVISLLVQV